MNSCIKRPNAVSLNFLIQSEYNLAFIIKNISAKGHMLKIVRSTLDHFNQRWVSPIKQLN